MDECKINCIETIENELVCANNCQTRNKTHYVRADCGCYKYRVLIKVEALQKDLIGSYDYASRLFKSLAPQCEACPDLMGVLTQIDNWCTGQRESITKDEILGAVARGWCHKKTEDKVMDIDLASAITDEVVKVMDKTALSVTELDISNDWQELIMIAMGEASMCWSDIDKAGVFDSTKAGEIGKKLLQDIKKKS